MKIKKVMVAGSGVLGSQIAFQTAFKGFEVNVYDVNDEAIEGAKGRFNILKVRYMEDLGVGQKDVDAAYNRLSFHTTIEDSSEGVDMVIEAIPELLEVKQKFYKELSKYVGDGVILASNSSTMMPSQIRDYVKNPERFLHLHFANEIWKFNVGEVMGHDGTEEKIFKRTVEFAEEIGMVPIPVHKEQSGYVLNTLLVPFLNAAQYLVVNGIAEPHTVDKTWMISTGAPIGPFALLDIIGINTPYNLSKVNAEAGDEEAAKVAKYLKEEFLDKGRMGAQSGKGFYDYPNPKYLDPDFLK